LFLVLSDLCLGPFLHHYSGFFKDGVIGFTNGYGNGGKVRYKSIYAAKFFHLRSFQDMVRRQNSPPSNSPKMIP
jgi:hypothetical protein